MLEDRPTHRKKRANARDKNCNGKTKVATGGPWAWQCGTLEVLGKAAARSLGATGCHARGRKCHTVSPRNQENVTPLSQGNFRRSDKGCQGGPEGVKGVTRCQKHSPTRGTFPNTARSGCTEPFAHDRNRKRPGPGSFLFQKRRRYAPSNYQGADGGPPRQPCDGATRFSETDGRHKGPPTNRGTLGECCGRSLDAIGISAALAACHKCVLLPP